ncbi:hypothetical protein BEH94_11310 [Candidatus Altiarchaeales archaeon WOR_SM1_SCG]|nr:hypothetical protein BEH94_11310 [Candidatus Altiarchaeales archaeon WOR_SM1_SCG]
MQTAVVNVPVERFKTKLVKFREEIDDLIEELDILNDPEVVKSLEESRRGDTIKFDSINDFKKRYDIE